MIWPIRAILVLLITMGCVAGGEACDIPMLRQKLERAMEPLDHAYNYEEIDTDELMAELERHVARLELLIASPPEGCSDDPGGSALLSYAERMRTRTHGLIASREQGPAFGGFIQ
jgi:hypothetical protein